MGRPEAKLGVKQDAFLQMLDLMRNPLAWTKVSGPERISSAGKPFHDAEPFVRELIAAAPDRILWGTDFPHPNVKIMPNDGELVDLFAKFCDDEAMRKKITGGQSGEALQLRSEPLVRRAGFLRRRGPEAPDPCLWIKKKDKRWSALFVSTDSFLFSVPSLPLF